MAKEAKAFLNGQKVSLKDAKVGIMTHALHYGTAVFEGIRGNWNESKEKMIIFRLKEHYDRLLEGCKMLMIDIPYSSDELCKITIELLAKNNFKFSFYFRIFQRQSHFKE